MESFLRAKLFVFLFLSVVLGIVIGGYLFSQSQKRSFLAIHDCRETCLKPNELAGLLASVGIQKMPGIIPDVVKETDKTIAFLSPVKMAPIHYIIIPKKDIKNAAEFTPGDEAYLIDAYAVMGEIVRENKLENYQIFTNGPGVQHVTYLHFHVMAR